MILIKNNITSADCTSISEEEPGIPASTITTVGKPNPYICLEITVVFPPAEILDIVPEVYFPRSIEPP